MDGGDPARLGDAGNLCDKVIVLLKELVLVVTVAEVVLRAAVIVQARERGLYTLRSMDASGNVGSTYMQSEL